MRAFSGPEYTGSSYEALQRLGKGGGQSQLFAEVHCGTSGTIPWVSAQSDQSSIPNPKSRSEENIESRVSSDRDLGL